MADHPRRGRGLSTLDRSILGLAVPALGALVAEPLFVLVDSAVVGRLGTAPLAGLALASTVLVTVVGLCVFLAYATTAAVARRLGAGDPRGALTLGVDGLWLALGLGVVLAVALGVAAPVVVDAMGAGPDVATHAVAYLRWSAPGLPGMLVVLAATGALRGLQDTRTPLAVAATGAVVNAVLTVVLVLGLGLGIAGSGLGTALTQLGMGTVLAAVVVRGARARGASLRPARGGVWANARAGLPLLVRTLSLRAAILLTVVVAAVAWLLPAAFSPDPDVRRAVTVGLLVAALFLPVAGWVFVLDGVLIGAGDGRYLAAAGMVTLVAYAPAAWAVAAWAPVGAAGLGWLWVSFAAVFMTARALVTGVRARGTAWMVTGA